MTHGQGCAHLVTHICIGLGLCVQGRILKVSGIKGKLTTFDEESGVKCLVVPAAARAEAEEAARTYQGWRPRMRLYRTCTRCWPRCWKAGGRP